MKIRYSFVSNSSSASFVIDKRLMTDLQINAVKNHMKYADLHFPSIFLTDREDTWVSNEWEIEHADDEHSSVIIASTSMDNFDMSKFLELIGVPGKAILVKGY